MNHDQVYEDIQDINQLKKHMVDMLEEYNSTPGVVNMDLVLFRDTIEHGEITHTKIMLYVLDDYINNMILYNIFIRMC